MEEVRVSVVIPLYNKALYVERAIRSVLAQETTADEIIVVDDGSTDAGPEIIRGIAHPRIRLIVQKNAGPGAARNRGVEASTCDFVAFLDADDEWLPDFLSVMTRYFEADPALAVACCGYIDDPPGYFRRERFLRQGLTDGIQSTDPSTRPDLFSWRMAYMSTCTTLVKKETCRKWGGYYTRNNCRYAEDQMLFATWLLNERVLFALDPHAVYHRTASELNAQRTGPRPLEPFLVHPEDLEQHCPAHLRPALDRLLAYRALRAATMLGYWGKSAEARALVRRFVPPSGMLSSVAGLQAMIACTPAGGVLGPAVFSLIRKLKSDDVAHVQTSAIDRGVPNG
jgi:glycosyltransferase involved in cell wall biosynthesis